MSNREKEIGIYSMWMPRKLTKSRPKQGAHLAALRKRAGLSQADLGRLVGETQQNVAFWEQSDRPPRSDVLPKMAKALGVTLEHIIDVEKPPPARKRGHVGKAQQIFEEVAKLPRRQQDKIIDVITAMVEQYQRRVR